VELMEKLKVPRKTDRQEGDVIMMRKVGKRAKTKMKR